MIMPVMRLSSGQGLYPSIVLSSACLLLVGIASIFQREKVVEISEGVAHQAKKSYQHVAEKIHLVGQGQGQGQGQGGHLATGGDLDDGSPFSRDDPRYLSPEWRWAADVSIVYTWVNGSEETQRQLKKQHHADMDGERDRDNDDLRHSFRALNKYLPWHQGTVYLVSPPGHVPHWLEVNHPRLKLINQNDILPKEDQPSFNSNCLEAFFHLIPGLSEQFIVLNDDYFFGRVIHPRDLFSLDDLDDPSSTSRNDADANVDAGVTKSMVTAKPGVKMFLEDWGMGIAELRRGDEQWPRSVRYTAQVIKDAYGEFFHEKPRITEHAPFVFDKRAYEGIHHRFNLALRRNCHHKFRSPDDAIVPFLLDQYIIQEGSRCCGIRYEIVEHQSKYFEWQLDNERNLRKLEELFEMKPTFFNINDRMGFDPSKSEQIKEAQRQLKDIMEAWLPYPSEFERIP